MIIRARESSLPTQPLALEGLVDRKAPSLSGLSEMDREQVAQYQSLIEEIDHSDSMSLAQAYGRLGQLYLAYEIFDAAGAALSNAALLEPTEIRWPYLAGFSLKRQSEDEAAIARFEEALRLDPDFVPARAHMAESLRNLERLDESDRTLDRIIEGDRQHAMAHYLMGLNAADQDDPAAAVAHLKAALASQPFANSLQYPLALAYRDLGETEKSEAALALRGDGRVRIDDPLMGEVISLRRDAGSLVSSAGLMVLQGRLDDAERAFRQAVEVDPDLVSARLGLGKVLGDLGQSDAAMLELEETLRLDPANTRASLSIAALHLQADDPLAAIAEIDRVLDREPSEPKANEMKGIILRRVGRCQDAIPNLVAAMAADEVNPTVRLNLLVCQAAVGDYASALETAEAGYANQAQTAAFTASLVRLLSCAPDAKLRDGARAVALAEELLEAGRSVDALEVLAMARAEMGQFEEAVELQTESLTLAEAQADRAHVLEWMRESLAGYERGTACREAWPPALTQDEHP